jgi:hypothetical protein
LNNLKFAVLANLFFFSSSTFALDFSVEKDGQSVRVNEGAIAIDALGTKLKVGNKPADSNTPPNIIKTAPSPTAYNDEDKIEPITHFNSSDIEFTNIRQHDLEITLGGSGNIKVTGMVENLIATINGSGNLELENLIVEKAFIKINASGDANVNVKRELKAEITGSGDIHYQGNPSRVIPKITGSGSVEKSQI